MKWLAGGGGYGKNHIFITGNVFHVFTETAMSVFSTCFSLTLSKAKIT
jgi:hypothetical protein